MEEKKDIGTLFDGIAGSYDRFNHLLSLNIDRYWRRKAVQSLSYAPELLDVAIGTADLSIQILSCGKAEHITGIDLSEGMMKIGAKKVKERGMEDRVSFRLANAQDMPFADARFDAVTCAYGVRNFANLNQGLQEMYRVLKPGGQLIILDFSYPSNPLVRWVYNLFFTHFMPFFGRLLSKDVHPYRYFCNSVKQFIWGQEMVNRIQEMGFREVTCRPMTLGISTLYTARK